MKRSELKNKRETEALKEEAANKLRQSLDFRGAVDCYTRIISLSQTGSKFSHHQKSYVYYNNRALAYLGCAEFGKAIDDCNKSLSIKENPKAYSRKASALGDLQEYDEGLECIEKALLLDPQDKEALVIKSNLQYTALQYNSMKASSLGDQGKYLEALEFVSKSLQIESLHTESLALKDKFENEMLSIYLEQALSLGDEKKFPDAFDKVSEALLFRVDDKEALKVKETLNELQEQHEKEEKEKAEAEEYRSKGSEAFQKRLDFKGAISSYTKAISLVKSNTVYFNNRALAYLLEGEYEKAIVDCDSSLAIKPNSKAYCRKASARAELGQLVEAIEDIDQALVLSPGDKEALNIKIGLLETKAQKDKIQREADEYRVEGTKKINGKLDFQGAVFSYTKAIALVNSNSVYYNNRALAYLLAKEYDKAISDCNSSLEIKKNPKAYCRRASALGELGNLSEALEDIDKALSLSPQDKEALNIKAGLLEAKAQHEERMRRQEIGLVLNDAIVKVEMISDLNQRAYGKIINKKFDEAIALCNESLSIRENPVALRRKASCCGELGEFSNAQQYIEKLYSKEPENSEILQAKERIDFLYAKNAYKMELERLNVLEQKRKDEEMRQRRAAERKRLYNAHLLWAEEQEQERTKQNERQLPNEKNKALDKQLKSYYRACQIIRDAEYVRLAKSAAFVSSVVDFATEVIVIHFEDEEQRLQRQIREESFLFRKQFRARGLRRQERDYEDLLRAQNYSRKRRAKKPEYFIQSDFFSLNLFKELKYFIKTQNDIDVNTLDSRLEVINPRKESNATLNKLVNDVSEKLFNDLSQNWGHLTYVIQYTEEEELTIAFDAKELFVDGKFSDHLLSRYMTNMAVNGIAAESKLRPCRDRWRRFESINLPVPPERDSDERHDDEDNLKKEVLVFSFYVPLYNNKQEIIHGKKTMQQEIDAFKKEKKLAEERKLTSFTNIDKIDSRRQERKRANLKRRNQKCTLPPVRVAGREFQTTQYESVVPKVTDKTIRSSSSESKVRSQLSSSTVKSSTKLAKLKNPPVTRAGAKIK